MLLCAGEGSRLGDLSSELPKPLLPVCDIPIIRYGVALLVGHGITDIVVNVHHLGDLIRDTLGDGSTLGANISYSEEVHLLGTGGGLKRALPLLDPHGSDDLVLSLNGKLIFDLDIHALIRESEQRPNALGTLVVRKVDDPTQWGALDARTDDAGNFNLHNIFAGGDYMFCGVHTTRPSVIRRLPAGPACSIRQGYLPWLRQGETVAAFDSTGRYFAEHSTPSRYLDGNLALLDSPLRFAPGELTGVADTAEVAARATLIPPFRVGPGAKIKADAIVGPHAVIGTDATVACKSHIRRSVVWARAQAQGDLDRCIVTRQRTVRA